MAIQNNLRYLLAVIKRGVLNNQAFVVVPQINLKHGEVLVCLHDLGFIQSFELRGSNAVIYLKQTHFQSWGKPLTTIFYLTAKTRLKPKKYSVHYKELNKVQELSGEAISYMLNTDRGILTGRAAAQLKIGGRPLLKIV